MAEERTRLQLSWKNKDKKLLNHGASTYEWVEPQDWRVSEVRLLTEVDHVGDETGNLLIEGDALYALTSLATIPEYADRFKGKVKLCYIDPPFNTRQTFASYKDSLENSIWLTMLRDRLVQIKELLAKDGSVWVHLDDVQSHRARVVLDEVFGIDNFVATVTWEKLYARKSNNKGFSPNHDTILVYRKTSKFTVGKLPATEELLSRYHNPDDDPRGPWQSVSFSVRTDNPERRGDYRYEVELPSGRKVLPPQGRHWNGKRERYEELLSDNLIWFGKHGDSPPRFKHFVDHDEVGLVPETIWTRDEVGDNDTATKELMKLFPGEGDLFDTPKPERLLQRIIELGTDPGDIVLDCFAGSGTTAAVAHKLGRQWVTVELLGGNVESYIKPRLAKVIDGSDVGGISAVSAESHDGDLPKGVTPADVKATVSTFNDLAQHGTFEGLPTPRGKKADTPLGQILTLLNENPDVAVDLVKELSKPARREAKTTRAVERLWSGGGGYTHLLVAESMFENIDGTIVLADWATNGALAEAVAAQLHFPYEPRPPFAGKKGRQWLAVIDGMLTNEFVDYLLDRTAPNETVVVVAQGLVPKVADYLAKKRKGSRARKVPRDLARLSTRTERVTLDEKVVVVDVEEVHNNA